MRRHGVAPPRHPQQEQQQEEQQDIEYAPPGPQHNFSNEHHESVRRRLFQSPMKVLSKRVSAALPYPSSRNELWLSAASTGSFKISRGFLFGFLCFGIFFLVTIHLYLFRVLLQSESDSNQVPNGRGTGRVHEVPNIPPINKTDATSSTSQTEEFLLPERALSPLGPIDVEFYTIRMNTWRRPEQLLASVAHHSSCPGVKQIQIVWCDKENQPPKELDRFEKVVVEYHEANSLNERFNILKPPPTLGILSIDDDVLRPCDSIDSGFFKWVKSPHRMVGFDARTHVENDDGTWGYGYLSATEKSNKYSFSLTRYCFLHRDYLDRYMNDLPKSILKLVEKNLNCEDIAMSFMISSLTGGQPSLLADWWAIKSLVKLYVANTISGSNNHKLSRDACVNSFATLLGLKDDKGPRRLKVSKFVSKDKKKYAFECGAPVDDKMNNAYHKSKREMELEHRLNKWRSLDNKELLRIIYSLTFEAGNDAYKQGLIANTSKSRERFAKLEPMGLASK